jgi:hypothetical protein
MAGNIMDHFPEFKRVRVALAELFLDHHKEPVVTLPDVERQLFDEWAKFPQRDGIPQCSAHELAEAMIARMEGCDAPPEVVDIFRRKFWDQYGTPKA